MDTLFYLIGPVCSGKDTIMREVERMIGEEVPYLRKHSNRDIRAKEIGNWKSFIPETIEPPADAVNVFTKEVFCEDGTFQKRSWWNLRSEFDNPFGIMTGGIEELKLLDVYVPSIVVFYLDITFEDMFDRVFLRGRGSEPSDEILRRVKQDIRDYFIEDIEYKIFDSLRSLKQRHMIDNSTMIDVNMAETPEDIATRIVNIIRRYAKI